MFANSDLIFNGDAWAVAPRPSDGSPFEALSEQVAAEVLQPEILGLLGSERAFSSLCYPDQLNLLACSLRTSSPINFESEQHLAELMFSAMRRGRGPDYGGLIKGVAGLVLIFSIAGFGIKGAAQAFVSIMILLAIVGVLVAILWILVKAAKKTLDARRAGLDPTKLFSVTSGSDLRFEVEDALDALDWFQLEKLVAALFETKGNQVEMRGGAKGDGGIDIVVRSESSSAAVQCKHWAKWKCGPAVVRELLGAMTHEGFQRGFLVCRTATKAARSLAENERITIVDRDGLLDRIRSALESESSDVKSLLFDPPKLCPKCGAAMVLRVATKGRGAGSEFWGCSTYPTCNQTMKA